MKVTNIELGVDFRNGINMRAIGRKHGMPESTVRMRLAKMGLRKDSRVKEVQKVSGGKPKLRILTLDIENAPMMSYHWGLWKQNIGQPMRVKENRSYMMSIAMKWLGDEKVHYFETRTEDDSALMEATIAFLDKADIVVGHNAKKFDVKKINAYAILNGIKPPSPYRVVDTMLIAKKEFMFERNTLEYLTGALCTQKKSGHAKFKGFDLWSECMKGNEEAWAEMKHYNIQDVISTEELYLVLRPYAKGHPNVSTEMDATQISCPTCGSHNIKQKGYSTTNVSKFERYHCQSCGAYSRGRINQMTKEGRQNTLMSIANG